MKLFIHKKCKGIALLLSAVLAFNMGAPALAADNTEVSVSENSLSGNFLENNEVADADINLLEKPAGPKKPEGPKKPDGISEIEKMPVNTFPFWRTLVVGEKIKLDQVIGGANKNVKYYVTPKNAVKINKKSGTITVKNPHEKVKVIAYTKDKKKINPIVAVTFKTKKTSFKKNIPAITNPGSNVDMKNYLEHMSQSAPVKWEVNCKDDVARIDNNGILHVGSDLRKSCTIKVKVSFGDGIKKAVLSKKIKIKLPKLNKTKATLKNEKGKSFTLKVSNTNSKNIRFESWNKDIATVDHKGVVRPVKPGKAKIACFVDNYPYVCEVTVK